jgi:hypothetical protein
MKNAINASLFAIGLILVVGVGGGITEVPEFGLREILSSMLLLGIGFGVLALAVSRITEE